MVPIPAQAIPLSHAAVTHEEILNGVFADDVDPERQVFWFHRIITDLHAHTNDPAARLYLDKTGAGVDEEATALLADVSKDFLEEIPRSNYFEYKVAFAPGKGISLAVPAHERCAALCGEMRSVFLLRSDMNDGFGGTSGVMHAQTHAHKHAHPPTELTHMRTRSAPQLPGNALH
jgi:hypothetical protein